MGERRSAVAVGMDDTECVGVGEGRTAVGVGGVVAVAGVSFGTAPAIGDEVGLALATPDTAAGLALATPDTAAGLALATPDTVAGVSFGAAPAIGAEVGLALATPETAAGRMAAVVPVGTAPRMGVLPMCVGRVTATGEPEDAAGAPPLVGIAGALVSPRSIKPEPLCGVGDGRAASDGVRTGVASRGVAVGAGPSREQPPTTRIARTANMIPSPGDGRTGAASGIRYIAGSFHAFTLTTGGSPLANYTLDSLRLLCVSGSTRNSMGVSCVILIGSSASWMSMSRR